ncbi:phosphotransferase [Micromonospora sp. NPDC005215]|uniref:phosphotransferase n=1 Tax=Micromonospora sp. NPDC005215 TaxID=3157024 RepID=UPI0033AE9037
MVDPVPLASGRDADVFAIDDRRVLRRYRKGGDVAAEAAVMAYVGSLGFPVPAVYEARGTDLVMERLDGRTMLSALIAGELDALAAADCLADLHRRLHALPPRLGERDGDGDGDGDGDRILHLDLHPDNVMLTSRGPVLIDWRNATEGPADLDVALSAVILAQVAVDREHPLAPPAATLLDAFLDRVGGGLLTVWTAPWRHAGTIRHSPQVSGISSTPLPSSSPVTGKAPAGLAGVVDAVGDGADPGRAGSGRVGSGRVGSGRVGQRVWLFMAAAGRPTGTAAEFTVVPAAHRAVETGAVGKVLVDVTP